MPQTDNAKIRLDKWLWAARFFKTRALAKAAIEGGKVQYEGQRSKVSKIVELDATIKVRQGYDDKVVVVKALSEQRKGAQDAQLLYEETADSIKKRMDEADRRRKFKLANPLFDHKPNKKERRQMQKFRADTLPE
ncbi:ribosome-associated heat shock protein Hsp15 [Bermanella sp. R86510]|uniref:ribosome-associated heat shock protein Hsp15 n=1 Tax=unclassified Bermanella TaxID=2627862 RepID=UPI0037CC2C9C